MIGITFARINWYAYQLTARLGPAGLWGLVIAFLCLSQLPTLQDMQQQLTRINKLAALKRSFPPQKQLEDPALTAQHQLLKFYAEFPERSDMTGQIENIFAAAKRYNLVLEHGGYEVTPGDAHKLTKCEIQLPIKGSYIQTRKFLMDVLQEMPNVALTAVDIQRQKIGDATVDAQIRLTLYYREA